MYCCTDCKSKFMFAEIVCESLEMREPPYRKIKRCPFCKSGEIEEQKIYHCQNCGVRLHEAGEYCSERCKRAGELLYAAEVKRIKEFLASPVAAAVREVEDYNRIHGTKYSYGQYFSLKEGGGLR